MRTNGTRASAARGEPGLALQCECRLSVNGGLREGTLLPTQGMARVSLPPLPGCNTGLPNNLPHVFEHSVLGANCSVSGAALSIRGDSTPEHAHQGARLLVWNLTEKLGL